MNCRIQYFVRKNAFYMHAYSYLPLPTNSLFTYIYMYLHYNFVISHIVTGIREVFEWVGNWRLSP